MTRILASNEDDDATAQVRSEFWDARWAECKAMVERAVDRGEVPALVDGRFLIEVFVAPIHGRALLTRVPVTTELLGALADVAIAGVSRK